MSSSFNNKLKSICEARNNRLCLGLDLDPEKLEFEIGNDLENMESCPASVQISWIFSIFALGAKRRKIFWVYFRGNESWS